MSAPAVDAAVQQAHARFDVDAAVKDVVELAAHDRYQASDGIMAAAAYVAERAEQAGLREVRLLEFAADGDRRWWSFRAPVSWTPVHAELAGVVGYPEQPYALAAYSAPTPPDGIWAPVVRLGHAEPDQLRGAIVAHDDPRVPVPVALDLAAGQGAAGFVTDQLFVADQHSTGQGAVGFVTDQLFVADQHSTGRSAGRVGRIELRPGARLPAFSLTPGQLAELVRRGRAHVVVRTHSRAPMPVVTGLLPGEEAAEVLLGAHLCHPRPSVNDNASGAAALLGAATVLAEAGSRRRGVRFLWAPEFTGMAAYLHDAAASVPVAAVNVDMAGQDQRRCGGPLIVERSPDHLPGFVSALTEHVVAALPQAARSYSGAVACDTWAWRATPFVGASDHSLLVDASIGCPTVTLGHWPDRFNHSSADTLDKLDPGELRRTAAVACATAGVLAAAGGRDSGERTELERIALGWGASRLLACLSVTSGGIEPTRGLLRHRTAVALGALDGLDALYGQGGDQDGDQGGNQGGNQDGEQSREPSRRWLGDLSAHVAAMLPEEAAPEPPGRSLRRTWAGPFNLRGLAEAAGERGRRWIDAQAARDRAGSYALMLALAHGIDGARDQAGVARYAEHAAELPVQPRFASEFLAVLVEAGWAEEV
ncbi:DUF4910 domain-containing protein [Acrocarpospora catenulata]|uniref:DUF4910 domain-containing protein n=1 Tax=Acrocarpospora catenulata TaxID=2836182 RepID=UPI001BDB5A85|nr:DUF4910 domain-containing protein [Acrocarpospora catenulata]